MGRWHSPERLDEGRRNGGLSMKDRRMEGHGVKQVGEQGQGSSLNEMEGWGDGRWRWRRVDDGLNEGWSREEGCAGHPICTMCLWAYHGSWCALTIRRQQETTTSWVKIILSGLLFRRECWTVEIHYCNTVTLTTNSSLNPSSDWGYNKLLWLNVSSNTSYLEVYFANSPKEQKG